MLAISAGDLRRLRRHAAEARPRECCGFLLGRPGPGPVRVTGVRRAANAAPGRARGRFRIAPAEYLAAELAARSAGEEVVGFYHSHPEGGSRPSGTDRRHALPGCVHLILAGAGTAEAWRLRPDRSRFDPVPLEGYPGERAGRGIPA